MSRKKQTAQAVYVGPTIPGVVKANTIFRNGLPAALLERMEQDGAVKSLVIPLEDWPRVRQELAAGRGTLSRLYQLVQANHTN